MLEETIKNNDSFSRASGCTVKQLEYLVRVARYLTESLDLEEVLSRIAKGAVDILDAHGCVILQLKDDGEMLVPLVAIDPEYQAEMLAAKVSVENSFSGRAIKARRGQIFNKAIGDQRGHLVAGTPEREESVISVPLIVDERVLGAITTSRMGSENMFSDSELWLVESFAHYAAIAFKNAQNYKALHEKIEEQTKTEIALRESETHFKELFNAIPAVCWTFDQDGVILEWNKTGEEVYGWSAEDIVGKTVFDLIVSPENVERTKDNIKAVFNGESRIGMEFNNRRADGTQKIVLVNDYPLINEAGLVEKGICAQIDITERKQNEIAVRESEAHFRLLLDHTPFGMAHVERETIIHYLNPKFTKMFGYTIEDIPDVDSWFAKLFPNTVHRAAGRQVWRDSTRSGAADGPPNFEYILTAKNGEEKLVKFNVVSLDDGSYILILEDITKSRAIESALKLSEGQLRQAQKMEAVGTLAGGIAHDFNNLLTAINGQAELAIMNLPAEHDATQGMKAVVAAGKRAARLTEQLLAFSRLQSYKPQPANLNQIIDQFNMVLRRLIKEDITIETVLSPSLPAIMADPHQLEQILVNLVVNARDAIESRLSPAAKREITIITEQIYLDEAFVDSHLGSRVGDYVCLTVRDTGVGMSDAVREKIFEPFFTTKEKGRGTGLGMATVYGIIKQNLGNIYVTSKPNVGTEIKIYWQVLEEGPVFTDTEIEPDDEIPTGAACILLVEDNEDVRKVAQQSLEILGYTVFEAIHGEDALALLEKEKLTPFYSLPMWLCPS